MALSPRHDFSSRELSRSIHQDDQIIALGLWGQQEQSVHAQILAQQQRLEQQEIRLLNLETRLDGGFSLTTEGTPETMLLVNLRMRILMLEERLDQVEAGTTQQNPSLEAYQGRFSGVEKPRKGFEEDHDVTRKFLQLESRVCTLEMEETKSSARKVEMSNSITKAANQLSDIYQLKMELEYVRALAISSVRDAGGQAECLEEVPKIKERLSRIERCLPAAVEDDEAAQSSSGISLQQLIHSVRLLEQQLGKIQSQMPNSDQEASSMDLACERSPEEMPNSMTPASECRETILNQLEYRFEKSIWDLALFVGTDVLDRSTSVVVSLCFVLNMCLLIGFIGSCIPLAEADFDESTRDEFHIWRNTVAHNIDFRNTITGESLAHSICKEKMYSPIAGYQLETLLQLRDYLDDPPFLNVGIPKGKWMCWLSIFVWYLTLTVELRGISDLCTFFSGLPIARHSWFDKSPSKPDKVCLVTVSRRRLVVVMIVVGLRSVVLVVLGYLGTLFLCHEISTQDMILNSVALDLMLNFDDYIFEAMVPRVPQYVVKVVRPIPKKIRPGWEHLHKRWNKYGEYMAMLLIYTVLFLSVERSLLDPFVEILRENLDALCGAPDLYDFVVTIDAIGMPWSATTPSSRSITDRYSYHAMREFLAEDSHMSEMTQWASQSSGRNNVGLFMHVNDASVLQRMTQELPEFRHPMDWAMVDPFNIDTASGWKQEFLVLGFLDFGDVPNTVYNEYLKYLLGQPGMANCSNVPLSRCTMQGTRYEAVVMKQLCPGRCGCDTPLAGTVANPYNSRQDQDGFSGCAVWNTRRKKFVDALDRLPCTDISHPDVFTSWALGVGDTRTRDGESLFDYLVETFHSGGCKSVATTRLGHDQGTSVCSSTTLSAICPESCGCNSSVPLKRNTVSTMELCPTACGVTQPVCITIKTTDPKNFGPYPGYACVFPFKYKGWTYSSCTTADWNRSWCAITLRDGTTQRWGDCPNTTACNSGIARGRQNL